MELSSATVTSHDAPTIVVTRAVPQPALDLLAASGADLRVSPHDRAMTTDELHAAVAGADAVVSLLHDRIDGALLDAAGAQLRCVANVAVGYDNVDVEAATSRGVIITNTPGVLTDATADLALALILAVTRRLGDGERLIRSREPWAWNMFFMLGTGLQGKTLGIVGLGEIGRATARRARAFGMDIVYTQRHAAPTEVEASLGGARYLALEELLASADIVSLHLPLSAATRHLIDASRLALMRPEAYLINTARGPIVDEQALADALRDGVIAGAALDVFEREPEVLADLLERDNVVLIPHLGSATLETRTAMAECAARNVLEILADRPALTPVNAVGVGAAGPG